MADQKNTETGTKKTLWQMIKFVLVSGIAGIIQIVLVNVLYWLMKGWKAPLPELLQGIFSVANVGAGHNNWGYVLPFFASNLLANVYGYFHNRRTTFKSDAPTWCFAVYLGVMICLILFSTWLQGVIVNAITAGGSAFWSKLAPTIASAAAGTEQMIILFPLEKFVLLRERSSGSGPEKGRK